MTWKWIQCGTLKYFRYIRIQIFSYSEAKNGTEWDNLTWHPSNWISVPLFTLSMSSAAATTHKQIHALPSTIPSCYRRLCVVTPAWTAYVPPRGAAAACSGSSSAAGCSRCCSAEGHMRQTMTTEGRAAIKQQIKPVRIYQEIRPCRIEGAANDPAKFVCKIKSCSNFSHNRATFVWNWSFFWTEHRGWMWQPLCEKRLRENIKQYWG